MRIYLILLLVTSPFGILYGQTSTVATYGIIIEKPKVKKDGKTAPNISEEEKMKMEHIKKLIAIEDAVATTLGFTLVYDQNEAVYQVSTLVSDDMEYRTYKNAVTRVGGSGKYYQNKSENLYLHELDLFGDSYLISDSLFTNKWVITKEQRTIGKFLCTKATHTFEVQSFNKKKRTITEDAWFAPELPVSFGPEGRGGLPGLIVELKTPRYTLQLTKLETGKKTKIKRPKRGKPVTKEEYLGIEKKYIPKNVKVIGGG